MLDKFTKSYLETALWSSIIYEPGDKRNCDPFDAHFDIDDFSQEATLQALEDCKSFQKENKKDLIDEAQAGHNFWLTRNHHGAGFWSGDYEKGKRLTKSTQKYNDLIIEINDNNTLYFIG